MRDCWWCPLIFFRTKSLPVCFFLPERFRRFFYRPISLIFFCVAEEQPWEPKRRRGAGEMAVNRSVPADHRLEFDGSLSSLVREKKNERFHQEGRRKKDLLQIVFTTAFAAIGTDA